MPSLVANQPPVTDPTPIFDLARANLATELLAAAVFHLGVFELLATGPRTPTEVRAALGLGERAYVVLFTALRAMGLVVDDAQGRLALTALAREHLVQGAPFAVADYVGLTAQGPGVITMAERLRSDRPAAVAKDDGRTGAAGDGGMAYIYRAGMDSAMEQTASARHLTLALAGRAKNVAPLLAARLPMDGVEVLLDAGGGTGIYSIALLQQHPRLRAIVWDRPEVLKVAAEMAAAYGVAARLELRAGDMFADPVPTGAQAILLSNILHDWDVAECHVLVKRLAVALPVGGRLLIHDVFLNDALDGPLPEALYSAALFAITEGRAYSAAEYRDFLRAAGLRPGEVIPTLVHCGVLAGTR